jgi:DNA-binding transcriptional regulator PaaX
VTVKWQLLVVRLSGAPSRVRVGIWRELRRLGAVSLGQSAWVLPAATGFAEGVERATALADSGGGEVWTLEVVGADDTNTTRIEQVYGEARQAEWSEFLVECDRYIAEIAKEVAKEKFTAAELDEEEQSLERLRRWYRDIRLRDVLGAPSAGEAARRLKECDAALEEYAVKVYEALQR